MKKVILILSLVAISLSNNSFAQIVNIPDTNFKAALVAHNPKIDTNGDGEIQVSEAKAFKGKMDVWVVGNERGNGDDVYLRTIGHEYEEIAFQAAREADPSAKLIYNDFDNHVLGTPRAQVTKEVVDRLKAKGLIDGVGFQMHIQGNNPPSKAAVVQAMRSYGLPVYVTEFDVNMSGVPGSEENRYKLQAEIYKNMLEAAIESGVCQDFVVFGLIDKLSVWETDPRYPGYSSKADPLPFDDNFKPKPAYYAMQEALAKISGTK